MSKIASIGDGAEQAMRKRVRREALHLSGSVLKRALLAGAHLTKRVVTHAGARGLDSALENAHRLPIQQSIDVAVPLEIAWKQWLELKHLPGGAQPVCEVERDGDELLGRVDDRHETDWSAEVIDEREQESFAWRSTEGSDSAGLVTFHPLGDRLTRLELTLDVQAEDVAEAARLLLHVVDRHARLQLRRFKVDAELLNPDIYDELLGGAADDED